MARREVRKKADDWLIDYNVRRKDPCPTRGTIVTDTKAHELTKRQALFVSYTLFVLVDLVVLNLFDEYWDLVTIESFTVSLGAALLLQVLLKLTIGIEHRVARHFKSKPGSSAKIQRVVVTYAILVGSKFVMLEAVDFVFGERVVFGGRFHGLIAFVGVIIAIILAEAVLRAIYRKLDLSV
jgi:hypothetical protein